MHLSGVSAGGDLRIEKIHQVTTTYNFVEAPCELEVLAAKPSVRFDLLFADLQPFGGRHNELDQLNSMLPRPGFAWVTGPAGSGKSSLLRAWIESLANRDGPSWVCHHFLSRPHGTASREFFLENLCRQLAGIHGLQGRLPTSVEPLQTLLTSLLSIPAPDEGRVVVVVDGLDEALGWSVTADLFPELPSGTNVILSGRNGHLPPKVTPTTIITLGPLTPREVGDILTRFDVPEWALREEALADICVRSQGDPFYVRLLAQDFAEGVIDTSAQLQAQPTGLDAYLGAWWDELLQNVDTDPVEVYDLLGVLALTKGPIGLEELSLVRDGLRRTGQLRTHVRKGRLRRYVMCDEQDRVALFHRRCQENLADWLGARELAAYAEDLQAFCRGWKDNNSAYPLLYYPHHLADDGSVEELRTLVSSAWLAAHLTRLGHLRAFSASVELAVETTVPFSALDDFVDLIRLSAVAAIAADTMGAETTALIEAGQENPSDVLPGWAPLDRASALHYQARVLAEQGRRVAARRFALEAVDLCTRLGDWQIKRNEPSVVTPATELAGLAVTLTGIGADEAARATGEKALRLARIISAGPRRDSVLSDVAKSLAEADAVHLAVEAVRAIDDGRQRATAVHVLIGVLARARRYDEALAIARLVTTDWRRLPLLVQLIQFLPAGERMRADVSAEVMAALAVERNHWTFGPLIAHCLPAAEVHGGHALVAESIDRAVAAVHKLDEPVSIVWSLASVVRGLARHSAGDERVPALLAEIQALADAVEPGMPRISAQRAVMTAMEGLANSACAAGDVAAALAWASKAEELHTASLDRAPLEYELPGASDLDWLDDGPRIGVLRAVALVDLPTALEEAKVVRGREQRDRALDAVLSAAVSARDWASAFEIAEQMKAPTAKAAALSTVATAVQSEDEDSARELERRVVRLKLASSASWRDSWAAADLAAEVARNGLMEDAIEMAQNIRAPDVRAWTHVLLLRSARPGRDTNLVPRLGQLAMEAAEAATAPVDSQALMTSRAFRAGDDSLVVNIRKRRQVLLPLRRRAVAAGMLLEEPTLGDQGDVRALLLPEVANRLAQHGLIGEAVAHVRALRDAPGSSEAASDHDWRTAQISACLAQFGMGAEALSTADGIADTEHALAAYRCIGYSADQTHHETEAQLAWSKAADALSRLADSTPTRTKTVLRYAMSLARARRGSQAITVFGEAADLVDALLENQHALPAMTLALVEGGSSGRAEELLALAASRTHGAPQRALDLAEAYMMLGQRMNATNSIDTARKQLLDAPADVSAARLLLRLALLRPRSDLVSIDTELAEAALRMAAGLQNPIERDELVGAISDSLSNAGAISKAQEAALLIVGKSRQLDSFLTLRFAVFESNGHEPALKVAEEMAEIAMSVSDPDEAADCWASTALAFGGIGESSAALTCLINALATSRSAGSSTYFRIIGNLRMLISSIDPAKAPQRLDATLTEIESWWLGDSSPSLPGAT